MSIYISGQNYDHLSILSIDVMSILFTVCNDWFRLPDLTWLDAAADLRSRCQTLKYSQLSLSRLQLYRITPYLEEKIWSLF